jgi:hypothetical protein
VGARRNRRGRHVSRSISHPATPCLSTCAYRRLLPEVPGLLAPHHSERVAHAWRWEWARSEVAQLLADGEGPGNITTVDLDLRGNCLPDRFNARLCSADCAPVAEVRARLPRTPYAL